jgi:hypothetical protein
MNAGLKPPVGIQGAGACVFTDSEMSSKVGSWQNFGETRHFQPQGRSVSSTQYGFTRSQNNADGKVKVLPITGHEDAESEQ